MTPDVMTRVAPLGLRFWDEVTRDVVRDGLAVTAWPESRPSQSRTATVNRAGVWALHSLPGMGPFERGSGDDSYWAKVASGSDPALGSLRPFVVQVVDTARRFLPTRLRVRLPVRGVFGWPAEVGLAVDAHALAVGAPPGVIPLPISPTRAVRDLAVIRAELAVDGDAPAANALVEVLAGERLVGRGVSDDRGRVMVAFPYPDTLAHPAGSPLGSPVVGPQPASWRWDLGLRVRYAPTVVAARRNEAPELANVFAQPLTTALLRVSPEEPLSGLSIHYGEERVLRTEGSDDGRLWIRSVV